MKKQWYKGLQVFAEDNTATDTTDTTATGTTSVDPTNLTALEKEVKEQKGILETLKNLLMNPSKDKATTTTTEPTTNIADATVTTEPLTSQEPVNPEVVALKKQMAEMEKRLAESSKVELEKQKKSLLKELGIDETIINEIQDERTLELVKKVGATVKEKSTKKGKDPVTEEDVIKYLQENPNLINVSLLETKIQEATTGAPKKSPREIVNNWKV